MGADHQESKEQEVQSDFDIPIGVGNKVQIQDAIIDKNARIGSGVNLSPVGLEDGWADDGHNVYIRDGVLVVVKNAVVVSGTTIGKE